MRDMMAKSLQTPPNGNIAALARHVTFPKRPDFLGCSHIPAMVMSGNPYDACLAEGSLEVLLYRM